MPSKILRDGNLYYEMQPTWASWRDGDRIARPVPKPEPTPEKTNAELALEVCEEQRRVCRESAGIRMIFDIVDAKIRSSAETKE